jgi:uncharacterized protein YjgD (DUF1641 family)
MTTISPTATEALEAKIDALTEQVAFLAQEAELARHRREMWTELQADVMPIAGDVLQVVERELEELSADVCITDFADLLRRLIRVAPILDQGLRYLEMFAELAGDLMPLGEHAMDVATDRLVQADQKGYFSFIKSGWGIVDRVVTEFSEEDVEALGDNIVLILDTVKSATQPEMMAALHHMVGAVQRQQARMADEPEKPPSLLHLAKRLRDPEVRRGMNRALDTLGAVAQVDTTQPVTHNKTKTIRR